MIFNKNDNIILFYNKIMEFIKIENQKEVEIKDNYKNIIINNCENINLHDFNSDLCFIINCKECIITRCNINNLFINEKANLLSIKFQGNINKYKCKNEENNNKVFSFHF